MTRDEIFRRLAAARPQLDEFEVESLFVFGSFARNEASASSDVDLLVKFKAGASVGMFRFVRLQRCLGDLLGMPVDLATPDALHMAMRDDILREAIRAA